MSVHKELEKIRKLVGIVAEAIPTNINVANKQEFKDYMEILRRLNNIVNDTHKVDDLLHIYRLA